MCNPILHLATVSKKILAVISYNLALCEDM